jgi:hypothetical protein
MTSLILSADLLVKGQQYVKTPCTHGFANLAARLSRSWKIRTGPLHYMMQAVEEISGDSSLPAMS